MKRKRKTSRKKLAAVARKTAYIMSKPNRWCQGYWCQNADGSQRDGDLLYDRDENLITDVPSGVDSDYVAANSPKAVKFCFEGAVYRGAGRVFKGLLPGYKAARELISIVDARIEADPSQDFDSGMDLNDDNGDASRKKLVSYLRAVERELTA